ncbi:MAG TPA: AsmA-like C-terminal region-containing protein [Paracoccaceae bacterium]|nr:AsmA-like C-terminal region-containing protein [Paracoccaceae bacterium]
MGIGRERMRGVPGRRRVLLRFLRRGARSGGGALLGIVVILVVLGAFAAIRLSEGPVRLPFLARLVEREMEAALGAGDLTIGAVVFALGSGDEASGLRLRDVELRDPSGTLLFSAEAIGARFELADAVRGELAPTALFVTGASGQITRDPNGRFQISFLPAGLGPHPGDPAAEAEELREGHEAISDFLTAMVEGRAEALRKLTRIRLTRVALTYDDRMSGRIWQTTDGRVLITHAGRAVSGQIQVSVDRGEGAPTILDVAVEHVLGSDALTISASFGGAWAGDVADQLPALAWLRPVAAPVSGHFGLEIGLAGGLRYLTADLAMGEGVLRPGSGADVALASGALKLAYDGRSGAFEMERLAVDTGFGRLTATGHAEAVRQGDAVTGLAADLRLQDVLLSPDGIFAAPVAFGTGRLRATLGLAPFRVEIAEATLEEGGSRLTAQGHAVLREAGWEADFTATGGGVDTRRLAALWPVRAAPGARAWLIRSMPEGMVTAFDASFRLGPGGPEAVLDFTYRDAVAYPLRGLPPIIRAEGTGRLDLRHFTIAVDKGVTVPEGRSEIDLAGSTFTVPDLRVRPTHADTHLKGRGEIDAILALLDHPPLGLMSRLGATPDLARGEAEVEAHLVFPLVRKLKTSDVAVEASAVLTAVEVPSPMPELPVRAERLALTATGRELHLEGPLRLGPATAALDWTERFRPEPGEPHSRIAARLGLTPALLAALGAGTVAEAVLGSAPARLTAERRKGAPYSFRLAADLAPASIRVPGLGWSKPEGGAGSLEISGTLGEELLFRDFRLAAGELLLAGSMRFDRLGRLGAADFTSFRLGEAIESGLHLTPGPDGRTAIELRGGTLDLLALGRLTAPEPQAMAPDPAAETAAAPGRRPEIALALDRLVLTSRLALSPAQGRIGPAGPGEPFLTVTGPANGGAETVLTLADAEAGMTLRLTTEDAGRLLRDAGYFRGAYGGRMVLDLALEPGSPDMTGRLVIRDILVRESPVLVRMLSIASITGVLETMTTGGLAFDEVQVPFRRRDGHLYLGRARATGGSIGLTVEGEYDEEADRLDLSGVFSPAYLLNGLLGEVPILGTLLTGRRGEGVFGFAYRVRGSREAPDVSVNPLSILTPGALRNVFGTQAPRAPARDGATDGPALPPIEEPKAAPPPPRPDRNGIDK